MAGCAGLDCGQRKGHIEDVKHWVNSLRAALASKEGRDEFCDFLQSCDLIEESTTVKFWEQCHEIVRKGHQLKKTKTAAGCYDSSATSALIHNASTVNEEYVNNCCVNLEKELIQRLNESVENRNPDEIADAFLCARNAAHDLLREIYSSFVEELVKKYGLTKK